MTNIRKSVQAYEDWMGKQLGPRDRREGHRAQAREDARRARSSSCARTYWRWAETILEVCPDLADATPVLAVGDIHLENFGTWRDADGRLVWGVNDFDEAARDALCARPRPAGGERLAGEPGPAGRGGARCARPSSRATPGA